MSRLPWMVASVSIIHLGCPHAWGRGGSIDQALEKDLAEYYRLPD